MGVMLKRLYIHNFKSFWESEFEFGKVNCLIAPNNTGKSNLVEALKFLDNLLYQNSVVAISQVGMDKMRNYHYDEPLTMIEADFTITNRILIGNELIDYELELDFRYWFNHETKQPNTDVEIRGKIKSITIDRADLKHGFSTRFIRGFEFHMEGYEEYSNSLDKKYFQGFNFHYNHHTLNYRIETRFEATENTINHLFALNIDSQNQALLRPINFTFMFNKNYLFSSHYFKADSMKRPEMTGIPLLMENGKNLPEFLETLDEETFEEISTSLIGEVELVNGISIEKGAVPKLVFKEEVADKVYDIGLQDISDGTVHFIAIMSAILGNREAVGIMIEEPERHMHMKVLSYILDTMRDSNKQIFFTTHSGELLKILKQNEIIFLYRDEDTGDTKSLNASKIKLLDKVFKRHKYELSDILKNEVLGYIGDFNG